ncbi:MAG: hypothetical protein QM784_21915 [Polyangiaceae bacterium]
MGFVLPEPRSTVLVWTARAGVGVPAEDRATFGLDATDFWSSPRRSTAESVAARAPTLDALAGGVPTPVRSTTLGSDTAPAEVFSLSVRAEAAGSRNGVSATLRPSGDAPLLRSIAQITRPPARKHSTPTTITREWLDFGELPDALATTATGGGADVNGGAEFVADEGGDAFVAVRALFSAGLDETGAVDEAGGFDEADEFVEAAAGGVEGRGASLKGRGIAAIVTEASRSPLASPLACPRGDFMGGKVSWMRSFGIEGGVSDASSARNAGGMRWA